MTRRTVKVAAIGEGGVFTQVMHLTPSQLSDKQYIEQFKLDAQDAGITPSVVLQSIDKRDMKTIHKLATFL